MTKNQNSANRSEGNMLYGILYTNNDIGLQALNREIIENKILPVLILRVDPEPEHGELHEYVVVPCFINPLTAQQFARRNLPKGHVIATIMLNDESIESLKSKGYEILVYNWPRRLTNYCRLDLEVIENSVSPEITRQTAYKV